MKWSEYTDEVLGLDFVTQRIGAMGHANAALIHAALGIGGEAGEVIDLIKKYVGYGKMESATFKEEVKREVGDLLWYVALLLDATSISLDEVLAANVQKLQGKREKVLGTDGGSP